MNIVRFVMCLSLSSSLMAAQTPWLFVAKDVTSLHRLPPTVRLAYGAEAEEFGLLRLPKGPGPYPVAIIIHGGCWLSRIPKSNTVVNVDNTEALADALRNIGVATWNIEYRRVDQPGGGFPGTFLDVAQAADYLREIAPKYHLNLDKVVVVGHSAGGHLALWLSSRTALNAESPLYAPHPLALQAAISLGGVPDLKLARKPAEEGCRADVIGQLLGSDQPEVLEARYAQTSPMEMLSAQVPQILFAGEEDKVVPEAFAMLYVQKAQAANKPVQLRKIAFSGHHEYIVPNSVVWPVLYKELNALLGLGAP
ncbi:MAG: alpha/beta hydrolase [Legionellaceae bacterium]|nr:alpha/beta hydrolase [Legionellaceae bacterium]